MTLTDEEQIKLDAQITQKLDTALKPLLDKLDAFEKKEKKDKEETEEEKKKRLEKESKKKTDADPEKILAAKILRANLKDCLSKDKLDAMSLSDLNIANQLKDEMRVGVGNPIEQKNTKTDSKSDSEWGCEVET